MKTRRALVIGHRRVIAMTCWKCGELLSGDQFARFRRGGRLPHVAYIDRRCQRCRWRHLEGREGRPERSTGFI